MSTKFLKREHRLDVLGLSLRAFARHYATMFPRSPVGRAARRWLQAKCPTCVRRIDNEVAERDASTQRVIARCFPAEATT